MGINPQAPLQEGKSVQYLAGFIYTDDGQAVQLPDGTLVRGRCEKPASCVLNEPQWSSIPLEGGFFSGAGGKVPGNLTKEACTGSCQVVNIVWFWSGGVPGSDRIIVPLSQGAFTGEVVDVSGEGAPEAACRNSTAGDGFLGDDPNNPPSDLTNAGTGSIPWWFNFDFQAPVVVPDITNQFECSNNDFEWISYAGTKYIESDFFPGEEWRRQVGYRWGNLASMSADGFMVPVSTQFRKPTEACFYFSCSSDAYDNKTSCEAAKEKWVAKKLPGGVCWDGVDPDSIQRGPTEDECLSVSGQIWLVLNEGVDACKNLGG